MRDWKVLSKRASKMESGSSFLLSNPEYELSGLPLGAVALHFEEPVVGGEDLSPKDIRSFLWENRKSRRLTRDRATIWRDGDTFGLGVITTEKALERLNNGD